MCIENNLGIRVTDVTNVTLLARLRQRREIKSRNISKGCVSYSPTEPELTEESSRHFVASLTDGRQMEHINRSSLFCSDEDLAHGEPCPYSDTQLAAFAVSHQHLRCCPATRPHPWNWRERFWCESKCKTPCGRADDAAENKRIIQ